MPWEDWDHDHRSLQERLADWLWAACVVGAFVALPVVIVLFGH